MICSNTSVTNNLIHSVNLVMICNNTSVTNNLIHSVNLVIICSNAWACGLNQIHINVNFTHKASSTKTPGFQFHILNQCDYNSQRVHPHMQQHIIQKMMTTEKIFSTRNYNWLQSHVYLFGATVTVNFNHGGWVLYGRAKHDTVCNRKPSSMTSVNFHLPNDRLPPGSRWNRHAQLTLSSTGSPKEPRREWNCAMRTLMRVLSSGKQSRMWCINSCGKIKQKIVFIPLLVLLSLAQKRSDPMLITAYFQATVLQNYFPELTLCSWQELKRTTDIFLLLCPALLNHSHCSCHHMKSAVTQT